MVHAQPPNLYLYNHQSLGKCKPYQQLKFFKIDTKSTKKIMVNILINYSSMNT